MGFESVIKTKKETKRFGKPYFLMGLLTIITLVLGAFLQEGIAFFDDPFNSLMSDIEFYCIFAVNVVALLFYFILAFRFCRLRPHPVWIILLALLVVGNTIAIYHFPNSVSGTTIPLHAPPFNYEYVLEEHFRLRYVLSFAAGCADLYIVFAIAPRIYRSARSLSWILYCFVIVTFFAIFYSIVKETDIYSYYLDPNQPTLDTSKVVLSFFNNRNTFAMVLLLAMAAVGILHSDSHHFWNFGLLFFLYFEIFFTLSKTGIIVATVYIFLFAFYRFGKNISYHKARAFLGLFIFLSLFASFIIIGHLQLMPRDTVIVKMYTNFYRALTRQIDNGFLDYRIEIWNNIFSFIKGDGIFQVFGTGEINSLVLLKYMWHRDEVDFYYAHNGFVHQIIAGGYLRLAVYIGILAYIFVVFVVNMTRKKRATFAYFLAILTLLLQGITETTSLLSVETKGLFFPLIFVVPMLIEFRKGNDETIEEEQRDQFSKAKRRYTYELSPLRKALVATLPILPVVFFFLGVVPFISHLKMIWFYQFDGPYLYILCAIIIFYAPISFYFCAVHKKAAAVFLFIINYLIIGGALFMVIFRPIGVNLIFAIAALAVMMILLALISIGRMPRFFGAHLLGTIIPVAIVAALFIGANHFFAFIKPDFFLVDGASYDTPTLNIAILIGEVFYFITLTFGLMPKHLFTFPLGHLLLRFDNYVCAMSQSLEDKVALREEIHSGDYVGRYYKDQIKNWKY